MAQLAPQGLLPQYRGPLEPQGLLAALGLLDLQGRGEQLGRQATQALLACKARLAALAQRELLGLQVRQAPPELLRLSPVRLELQAMLAPQGLPEPLVQLAQLELLDPREPQVLPRMSQARQAIRARRGPLVHVDLLGRQGILAQPGRLGLQAPQVLPQMSQARRDRLEQQAPLETLARRERVDRLGRQATQARQGLRLLCQVPQELLGLRGRQGQQARHRQ